MPDNRHTTCQISVNSLSPVLMVLRDLAHADLADILQPLESRLRNSKFSTVERELVRDFAFRYGNTERLTELKQIIESLKHQPEGDNPMSVADMLREEAFEEGLEEGEARAMRTAATNLLKNGISPEMVMRCTGINRKELDKLIVGVKDNDDGSTRQNRRS